MPFLRNLLFDGMLLLIIKIYNTNKDKTMFLNSNICIFKIFFCFVSSHKRNLFWRITFKFSIMCNFINHYYHLLCAIFNRNEFFMDCYFLIIKSYNTNKEINNVFELKYFAFSKSSFVSFVLIREIYFRVPPLNFQLKHFINHYYYLLCATFNRNTFLWSVTF